MAAESASSGGTMGFYSIRSGGLRAILLGCSAIVTSAFASQVLAQAAPDQGATLTEIVVTAQRREQSLQDVPISITAVTQDVLRANRITNVNDLNAVAPNMTVRE